MIDMWFKPYGPPKVIETDQEGGMVNVESKKLLSQFSTHIKERGVGSHATMVERHHQVLRDTHAKAKDQANKEGTPFTEESLLAEVVIAKNILTNISGYSPMQAVFGVNPALLPDLTLSDGNLDEGLRPHCLI